MNIICELPYRSANIDQHGNVYPCCCEFCSGYSFGNIKNEPFEQIWNGERAIKFREQFIKNEFNYCNLDVCLPHRSNDNDFADGARAKERPASVVIGFDRTCNVKCIFCNPEKKLPDKELYNFDSWAPDVFKGVKRVNVSSGGETLASNYARELIKYISKNFSDIEFDILTNGLLFDEENLTQTGIINKLNQVGISFHAMKESTYNKLVKHSNYKKVRDNINYAIKLKQENKISELKFRFVITAYNYKEMIEFAKFAKKSNAKAVFMECIQFNMPDSIYKKLNIINENHKDYNNFLKVLKNPIFKEDFAVINKELFNLQPVNKFPFPLWLKK